MFLAIVSKLRERLAQIRLGLLVATMLVVGTLGVLSVIYGQAWRPNRSVTVTPLPTPPADGGKVLSREQPVLYAPPQAEAVSRENFGALTPSPQYGVRRTVIQYRSYDEDGAPITIYARVYQPVGKAKAPIFGFASGTVGIDDHCAPSLEQPHKVNWANYESHMVTYAGQGYATVITDYEGMRDPGRLHHYMVGPLEGRAVLDSVRALINMSDEASSVDTGNIFVGGYSQGGHSAFWADQIASTYAPELEIKGVIGFGPVMDVQQTLADIQHGANINWFGPYVLTSYEDYYHDGYNTASVLLPHWQQHMRADVLANCIDTDLTFWPRVPAQVYTPEFLTALQSGLATPGYTRLRDRMQQNITGSAPTTSAKLINHGAHDNVVLPAQSTEAMKRLCPNSRGPVQLKIYPNANHYNAMVQSFQDTLSWMREVMAGRAAITSCGP